MAQKFLTNVELDAGLVDGSNSVGTSGQVLSSTGTVTSWIDQSTISAGNAEHVVIYAKNTHTASIAKGTPVYITGTVGATDTVTIAPADASNSAKMPAVGILDATLAINDFGYVITGGFMDNITTDPIDGTTPSSNDTVYVKAGGGLTMTKPTGVSNLIQNIAKVGKVSGGNAGSLIVSSILRTNDVPNLTTGKIWVGSSTYTTESGVVHLDEGNSRMGINTTSPGTSLQVNGTGEIIRLNDTNATANPFLTFYQNGTRRSYVQHVDSGDNFTLGSEYGGIRFLTGTGGTETEKVRILSNGNVGIGTTSPGGKLHVKSGTAGTYNPNASHDDITIEGSGNVGLQLFSPNSTYQYVAFGDPDSVNAGYIRYNHGSNAMVFRTNASDNMVINSSGNVGIGETSIDARLHITTASSGLVNQKFESAGSAAWRVGIPASQTYFAFDNANDNLSAPKVIIDSGGQVGIGTTSPSVNLDIEDSSNVLVDINTTTANANTTIRFQESGSNTATIGYDGTNDGLILTTGGFTAGNGIFIDNSQNVGIGTTSPSTALDVNGSIQSVSGGTFGTDSLAGSIYMNVSNQGLLGKFGTYARNLIKANASQVIEIGHNSALVSGIELIAGSGGVNGYISLKTKNSSRLYVSPAGNIGIGTTSPADKLHVAGNIYLGTSNQTIYTASTAILNLQTNTGAIRVKTDNGATVIAEFQNAGSLQLGQYGSGTFTGTAAKMLAVDSSGNVIEETISSATIGGSGTTNYIPVFTGSTTIANSIMSQSSGVIDVNGTIRYDEQIASNFTSGAKAFIAIQSGSGAAKYKVYKNTNTTDGYARFKLDRAYDYGNSDQMVQEAIYQRRTTTKNVKFRYDGDIATTDDAYLEFYELTDGTVEGWICVDDYSKCFAEIYYDSDTSETYPNPSSGTPTGTLIHSTNPDTETPNWDTHQGSGTFNGDVNIDSSYALQFGGVDVVDVTTTYTRLRDMAGATRIYLGASDAQNYYDNNSHRFRSSGGGTTYGLWQNSGLGIGETSIDARLHITTASSGLVNQKFESAGSAAWRVGIPASQTYFAFDNANDNLSAPKVIINSSGNVGVGTTSPARKLQVGDGTADDRIRTYFSDGFYSEVTGYGLELSRGTSYIRPTGTTGTKTLAIGGVTNWNIINSYAASDFRWNDGSSSELMRLVSSTGRLGIGTTSPSEKLQINSGYIKVVDNAYDEYFLSKTRTDGSQLVGFQSHTLGDLSIHSAGSESMRIASNGNVGIGTTSPAYPLDVTGNARLTGDLYVDGGQVYTNSVQARVKYSVWSSTTYGIGMQYGYSYGHLTNDYAMTFQMNDDNDRGFWWGDNSHTNSQGAMSLTTTGEATIATSLSVGEGESITSPSDKTLYVNGETETNNLSYTYPTVNNQYRGEIVTFGTFDSTNGAIAGGDVIVYTTAGLNSGWMRAQGNTTYSKGMLGIAMGTNVSDGVLIKGFARNIAFASGGLGSPLYLDPSNAGDTTSTIPSSTNNIVRIVGYMLSPTNDEIFFDPDKSWVQVS